MIFTDLKRLRVIAKNAGAFQIIFAGKAHPRDGDGKNVIRRIFECQHALRESVRVVYFEDYNIAAAKLLVAGADVWLNTPFIAAFMPLVPEASIGGWRVEPECPRR